MLLVPALSRLQSILSGRDDCIQDLFLLNPARKVLVLMARGGISQNHLHQFFTHVQVYQILIRSCARGYTPLLSAFVSIRSWFRSRAALQVEILALRHQLSVLKRSQRGRLRKSRPRPRVITTVWNSSTRKSISGGSVSLRFPNRKMPVKVAEQGACKAHCRLFSRPDRIIGKDRNLMLLR